MGVGKTLNILGNIRKLRILTAPRFKKGFTIAPPLPWDRAVYSPNQVADYLKKNQPGIVKVLLAFADVAHRSAMDHKSLKERMQIIASELGGKRFVAERKKKVRVSILPLLRE